MSTFPSIFISHGAPDLLLRPSETATFFKQLGIQLGKPDAILVVSAHWLSPVAMVSTARQPATIHDFFGFPAELYQLTYPAPGAPALAERVVDLLNAAGIESRPHPTRGLDHGAWEPLMLMYPDADVPVTQLSLQPRQDAAYHYKLGQALASLRQDNVLILTSGSLTHNLGEFGNHAIDAVSPSWVLEFDRWIASAIATQNIDDLLNYRQLAPYAVQNHPSEEHLLPLFVAMGAGGRNAIGSQLHTHFSYGILSMAAYAFDSHPVKYQGISDHATRVHLS